jgi:para-aminobenzoate synthetase component 1
MLESLAQEGSPGRYSIYAWDPIRTDTVSAATEADPFARLADLCRPWLRLDPDIGLPFVGGWIGYLAYEAGRLVEPTAGWHHPTGNPVLSHWALYDTVLIHDHLSDSWIAAGVTIPPRLAGRRRPPLSTRLDALEHLVADARPDPEDQPESSTVRPAADHDEPANHPGQWNYSRDAYLAKVERVLQYIRAGDIFQANLARRCRARLTMHPIELYQRLCEANPAAYAAYIAAATPDQSTAPAAPSPANLLDQTLSPPWAVLSSSPESFLSVRGRNVTTRPIKGTRPRGRTPQLDLAARHALMQSEKDRAELNMIIDLQRNDLGRVCQYGTVRVACAGELETCPTVLHRTATITGRLRGDADVIDLLRATFPGGSVTGAPKVRAMQIINELEPHPRGPYCGAIGYLGLDGDAQLNLAIRTMLVQTSACHRRPMAAGRRQPRSYAVLHVGSGIVADSDPLEEYAELQAKAAGMLAALNQARCPITLLSSRFEPPGLDWGSLETNTHPCHSPGALKAADL